MATGLGEAYLHEDCACRSKDVGGNAVWLAIALRRLTPMHFDLVFCHEGFSFDVRVPAETTEAELMTLMRSGG